MPSASNGAQRASHQQSGSFIRSLVTPALIALVALAGQIAIKPAPARAGDVSGMKAVIIVGPASGSTHEYLALGGKLASQAEDAGMDVRRVFHPHATWERVLNQIQGANLVVYLGHGNGWPGPDGPYQEDTKDGFGLNPNDGSSAYATKYYGANKLRDKVHLARNAVVLLYRLCYSAGNGEQWMGPEFNRRTAVERADNFAAGFLDIGASAVFAYGSTQVIDFPGTLARTGKTMDGIFMTSSPGARSYYDAFVGWDDYYRSSDRTPGARLHMDPHPQHGHYRAVTGRLTMTANEWRGEDPPPDTTPPSLHVTGALSNGKVVPADTGDPATFSPNGDRIEEHLVIDRTLSEPAYVDVEVRNGTDQLVRAASSFSVNGPAHTTWDGRNQAGNVVGDGVYRLTLTPRDRAGNVGAPRIVVARVLTTLKSPHQSADALYVADRDDLAGSTRLGVTLTHDAAVTWRIRNGAGRIVRTYLAGEPLQAGALHWTWSGLNDAGKPVTDGWYMATVGATTDVGTVRLTRRVYVGAYQIQLSDTSPKRGQRLRVMIRSTELLARPPRIEISQPGRAPVTLRAHRVGGNRFVVHVTLRHKGKRGKLRLRVLGRDAGGQAQTGTRTVHIH